MRTKDASVDMADLHRNMWAPLWELDRSVRQHLGYDLTITSAGDSKHSAKRSDHYSGRAVDMRTWTSEHSGIQLVGKARADLLGRVAAVLGTDWVVLDEATHFHISYRPTYGGK